MTERASGWCTHPRTVGRAREELGVPDATTHSFRKTVATLIDDEGLSARIGADHLGHSHVSMIAKRGV
jgi:integrase